MHKQALVAFLLIAPSTWRDHVEPNIVRSHLVNRREGNSLILPNDSADGAAGFNALLVVGTGDAITRQSFSSKA
jgi:hypothetical protein